MRRSWAEPGSKQILFELNQTRLHQKHLQYVCVFVLQLVIIAVAFIKASKHTPLDVKNISRQTRASPMNLNVPLGKAVVLLCEICQNEANQEDILLSYRYKVNIHMQIVEGKANSQVIYELIKTFECRPESKEGKAIS